MNEQEIKIGFVGVGSMGQSAHLRNYIGLAKVQVAAIAEVRPELARRVAAKFGVPKVYGSAQEMLAHEKLDGLVAPQPFTMHGQIVAPLYKANLPILTEKPLAASVAVGAEMLRVLAASKSWHMVGYHKRSDPAVMWAKREIVRLKSSGELGALRYVRILMPSGDFMQNGMSDLLTSSEPMPPMQADAPPSDMDAKTYEAYVSFVNYYIHQVNLLRHLLGESYRVTHADPSGVLLVTQSEDGVCGTIEMTPYQTTRDWQESALVAFDRGWIKIELPAPLALNRAGRVRAYYDGQPRTNQDDLTYQEGSEYSPREVSPVMPSISAMRQQAINFVRAIRGEIAPLCGAEEALEDLRVARDYIRLWKGV